jgi:YD repeat-containing protein
LRFGLTFLRTLVWLVLSLLVVSCGGRGGSGNEAVNGVGAVLASHLRNHPLGPVASWVWGTGNTGYARSFNLDGRVLSYRLGASTQTLSYDAAGRITAITDSANSDSQIRGAASPHMGMVWESSATVVSRIPFERVSRIRRFPWRCR